MYSTICDGALNNSVLVWLWRKSIHYWRIYARKTIFTFSLPVTLTFRPQVCSLVTLVQRYVFTTLEVSMAFLFRENRRQVTDGQTDGRGATHNVTPMGRIITFLEFSFAEEHSTQASGTMRIWKMPSSDVISNVILAVWNLTEFNIGPIEKYSIHSYRIVTSVGYHTSKLYRDTDTDTWFKIVSWYWYLIHLSKCIMILIHFKSIVILDTLLILLKTSANPKVEAKDTITQKCRHNNTNNPVYSLHQK